ncbi:sensor histidine kinase [Vineibacter terrae]|uniref:sensor histidine kinase n=1 Tax=Vineibacter terrae TaxID=2586908 RepID=UPI002E353589|nr:stimulus-sensing domain-containing protein [Vineibacter terrae]HEX2891494.1 stimulus-sensing domain-containing protein [Vineibacter terrae]
MELDIDTATGNRSRTEDTPASPADVSRASLRRPWWRRWGTGWLFPAHRRAAAAEPPASSASSLLRRRHRGRRFSPLTRRVLLLNMLPIALLAAGVVFLGDYEDTLIEAELAALTVHGEIVATGLGEGAVRGGETTINRLDRDHANQLMARLTAPIGIRGRLFAETGEMLGDTRTLRDRAGRITSQPLPPPNVAPAQRGALTRISDWIDARLRVARSDGEYIELPDPVARDYPWVEQALRGINTRTARRTPDGRLMLSVAVPVQRYKQVLGALMLTHDDAAIAARIRQVRLDVFRIAAVALAATVLLSLFLASTIARPIQRLARAADQIRFAREGTPRMPNFGARNDEIGDLADSLRAMTDALWQRIDAIDTFAADVAHELKNPLTSLRSAVEVAARIDDKEKRAKLMEIVLDDVKRLDRLISDIADSSRLDAELLRSDPQIVDVGRLLSSMADAYNATAAAEVGVRVQLNVLGSGTFLALGHEGRYGQVFRNIVDNGISFSPEGGSISIGLMRERDQVVVTIDDQGPGIPDANLESIFRRFYSERPNAEQFGKHSGLGLSICRQIVDAYGGSIAAGNLRSPDGQVQGARFTLRLPMAS